MAAHSDGPAAVCYELRYRCIGAPQRLIGDWDGHPLRAGRADAGSDADSSYPGHLVRGRAAELIAEQVITDPGQVPIKFEVSYDQDDIDSRNTYSVSARIDESDGRLAFINDTAYDVITRGNPKKVNMVLVEPPPEMVDGEWSAEDRLPVEEPVHVTGTDIIWEGKQVYVHVVFEVSDVEGCYRRGREEATVDGTRILVDVTAWVPPPAPWAMDCSDRNLELDAVVYVSDSLATGETYTVEVNGKQELTSSVP